MPEALNINDRFLIGLKNGLGACYADDHIIGHHTWNYLLAWRDFVLERPAYHPPAQGRFWLENARILIERRKNTELYLALNKGGTFKFFRDNQLVISDTQFSLSVRKGRKVKNAVGHLVGPYEFEMGDNEISIWGQLGWAKQKQMTPMNLMILRIVMLTVGRFFPNLIRKILQRVLITGKQSTPFQFSRHFRWDNGTWCVLDELHAPDWRGVLSAGIGSDQTSIYVVMSRTFQKGQLQPWLDLTPQIQALAPGKPLTLERKL